MSIKGCIEADLDLVFN